MNNDAGPANLAVRLKGPYTIRSLGRTTWPRRAPGIEPDHTLEECDAASTALFGPIARQNRRNLFCDAGRGGQEASAVGSLVLTAPAQGVIVAASALTPTSAITRFMLQASTLSAISVDTLRRLRINKCVAPIQHTRIVRLPHDLQVVKWLTIEYEDPWTRGKQRKRHSRRRPRSLWNPWRGNHPSRMPKSWFLFASIGTFSNTSKNPVLAGRIGSTMH